MRYYKLVSGDYIISIGTGSGGAEITETEYKTISAAIAQKPQATETTDYSLKTDLTWEPFEIEHVEPDISDDEAFQIILGGTP